MAARARPQDRSIDTRIGARIRERRILLGWTQQQLADGIGVACQQLCKYEHGINRVSPGTLVSLSTLLGVSIAYFFEGVGTEVAAELPPRARLQMETARNFSRLPETTQRAIADLVRRFAEAA